MVYTFECGSCHSIYKLDESQITSKGVKITCPKCLSYFILKKGLDSTTKLEAAYIEYVVENGVQEQIVKPTSPKLPVQLPSDAKTEKASTDTVTEKMKIADLKQKAQAVKPTALRAKTTAPEVSASYPVIKKKKSKYLPYLMIILMIVGLLCLYWTWL